MNSRIRFPDGVFSTELAHLQSSIGRMQGFVDSGNWDAAPWWEGQLTEHFVESIKDCRLFVDIGAELGFYSYLALRNMPSDGRIIAFEPDPLRFAVLSNFFAPFKTVKVVDSAAFDQDGEAEIVKSKNFHCATCANLEGEVFRVRTVRLDGFLAEEPVDVIKMDIEGAEANAFVGMAETLARNSPKIYFEVHPWVNKIMPGGLAKIENLLSSHGYRLFNCDFDRLVETSRIVGSRLYACSEMDLETRTQTSSVSRFRSAYFVGKVRIWLRLKQLIRQQVDRI